MTTQPQTPARPAAVDLDAARVTGQAFARAGLDGANSAGCRNIGNALLAAIADLAATRQERDAARATVREWIAANGPGGWIDDLRKAAPAPVPAADVADVPAFLRARVNGGAR